MRRRSKDFSSRAKFYKTSGVHHGNPVGNL
jgi:hypothetical protein